MTSPRLSLRYYGDPILRAKAAPVTAYPPELADFVQGMFECMYREEGIGLAAPQVGEGIRVFVVDVGGDERTPRVKRAFVNPVIVEKAGSATAEEGCLSIPGYRADVKRAARVVVEALDERGAPFRIEAEGLLARALQHETDHLDGVLFVDRLGALQRKLLEGKLKRFQAPGRGAAEASGTAPTL
ncbi:MAG TPA: peptide deformylase [Candidatus Eisenbacteria bacterium]|nr:peptide deformylase [Candidatus Eisenbacteria bacterium]